MEPMRLSDGRRDFRGRGNSPFSSPWPALDTGGGGKRVATAWQARLGALFPAFKTAFLQRAAGLASSYPCPRECGCAHEVIPEGPDEYVAVCRCERWNCDAFAVAPEALALWELSWSRFGRALCAGLGLQTRAAETGLPNTRQIGAWSAAAVPVLLTLPGHPDDLRQVAAELGTRLRRPYLLLAPTSRHLTAVCLELLADAGAGFFDLASHVVFTPSGELQPLKAPGELFSRFTPEPAQTDGEVVERAFALVKALDSERPLAPPSIVTTFSHYCLEGFNVSRIARKFRCSRATVLHRLALIRRRTGTDPNRFRLLSPQVGRTEDSLADPRARNIHRKQAVYGEGAEEEE